MKEKICSWQTALFVIVVIKNFVTAVGGFICIHNDHRFLGCLSSCFVFVELCVALIWYFAYIKDEEDDNYNYFDDVE
jgi:hypothetical protein